MEDIAAQFLYQILSYLPLEHTFRFEQTSKNLQAKLRKNPYYLNHRFEMEDLKSPFDETKLKIKDKLSFPKKVLDFVIPEPLRKMLRDKEFNRCRHFKGHKVFYG